jgi:hypothetical protein
LAVFDDNPPPVKTVGVISYVSVLYRHRAGFSFDDVLKVVSAFGGDASTALSTAAPFLGPVAGPAAAIAGAALSCASHIGESSLGPESNIASVTDFTGFVQRGILAESALSTILDLPVKTYLDLNLAAKLKEAYNAVGPYSYGLGSHVLPIVMQPTIAVGVDAYRKETVRYDRLKRGEAESSNTSPQALDHPPLPESMDSTLASFLTNLWDETVKEADEGWFFQNLGQVIYDAVMNERSCTNSAPRGLSLLSSLVAGKGNDLPQDDTGTQLRALELRAIMGEAALQALIASNHNALKQEACFDTIKQYAQDIGRQAMQAAEWMLPRVAPIVVQLLNGQAAVPGPTTTGGSGTTTGGGSNTSGSAAGARELKKESRDFRQGVGFNLNAKTFNSPGLDPAAQLVRMAALTAHESKSSSSYGEKTVREMMLERLRSVNLDGLQYDAAH